MYSVFELQTKLMTSFIQNTGEVFKSDVSILPKCILSLNLSEFHFITKFILCPKRVDVFESKLWEFLRLNLSKFE